MVLKQVLYPEQVGIWSVGFCRVRKTREPREKPLTQGQNQTQATLVVGECSHHSAIPALLMWQRMVLSCDMDSLVPVNYKLVLSRNTFIMLTLLLKYISKFAELYTMMSLERLFLSE